jgi:hypothetical protein
MFRSALVVLVAVLAIGAAGATSATAAFNKTWEISKCVEHKGSKLFEFIESSCKTKSATKEGEFELEWFKVGATPVNVTTSGSVRLFSNGVEIQCNVEGKGTGEEKGKGKITSSSFVECQLLNGGGLCVKPVSVEAVDLPWGTQLVEVEIENAKKEKEKVLRDEFTSSGAGNPGLTVKCKEGVQLIHCTAAKVTGGVKNEVLNDTVSTVFDQHTETLKCVGGSVSLAGKFNFKATGGEWLRAT